MILSIVLWLFTVVVAGSFIAMVIGVIGWWMIGEPDKDKMNISKEEENVRFMLIAAICGIIFFRRIFGEGLWDILFP